jgi:F0F1-type ATP synthase membrane subunit b/b'
MIEDLTKLLNEVKAKIYKEKEELIKDITKVTSSIHDNIASEIAKAKKEGRKVDELEKEFKELLSKLDKLKENQGKMSIKDIKSALDTYIKKTEDIVEKLKKK